MIDQHHFGATVDRGLTDLLGFAATDKETRIGALATTRNRDGHADPRRLGELCEFFEIFGFDWPVETNANEDGTLAAAGTLKHVR